MLGANAQFVKTINLLLSRSKLFYFECVELFLKLARLLFFCLTEMRGFLFG